MISTLQFLIILLFDKTNNLRITFQKDTQKERLPTLEKRTVETKKQKRSQQTKKEPREDNFSTPIFLLNLREPYNLLLQFSFASTFFDSIQDVTLLHKKLFCIFYFFSFDTQKTKSLIQLSFPHFKKNVCAY